MITKLTPAQEALLATYREKWISIGTGTEVEPLNLDRVKELVNQAYIQAEQVPPKEVIVGDSPLHIARLAYEKSIEVGVTPASVTFKEYFSTLNYSYGQHDANWLGFYEYISEVLDLKDCEKLRPLMELAKLTNWHLFFNEFAFVARRPVEIHRLPNGNLHRDLGPALRFADNFSIYALNGVVMPSHIVLEPAYRLDPKEVTTIKNAEVRREFVRKVGVTALMDKLGAVVLDESADKMYQLVNINIGDGRVRPYLKMLNPSIHTYHVEGVHPSCKTVADAIKFRNGGNINSPKVLT